MADEKPALVVHLDSGRDPLLFALRPEDRAELEKRLHLMLEHSSVETVHTKDNARVTINFGHVAVAYIDDLNRKGTVFGLH
ncbi:MAG: hypothetical protein ACRDQW_01285 [Haloechinothrix sp.]